MIHVLDYKSEKIVATLENRENAALFWDDIHKESLKDNLETFDFTMQADVRESEYVAKMSRIVIQDDDGFFREFIVNQTEQHTDHTKDVFSNASYSEIKKQSIIDPVTLAGQTVITAGQYVLNDTSWRVGITEYSGAKEIVFEDYTDPLSALKQVASEFGLELRFRIEIKGSRITGRFVDFIKKVGIDSKKEIEFGKDLIGITRKENIDNLVTALKVIGPEVDGQRHVLIVKDEDARKRWGDKSGRHLWDVYEPQIDPQGRGLLTKLQDAGEAELKRRINSVVEYTAEQASIEHIFGYEHEKVRIGNTLRIKDTSYVPALYIDARVNDVERSISIKTEKKYMIGDFIEYDEDDIMRTFRRLQKTYAYKIFRSQIAPPGQSNVLWIQTFEGNEVEVPHTWNSDLETWEKASPTQAAEIGAETPAGATEKANTARDEAIEHTDTRIRDDLRLDAPLPTNISQGPNGIKAVADGGDPEKYAVMDYRGFYAKKGAFAAERPDGALWVVDGVQRNNLIVQRTDPPFKGDNVQISGRYYRATLSDYDFIGAYEANHEGRYLKVQGYVLVGTAGCGIAVQSFAGGVEFYQTVTILKGAAGDGGGGVPFQIIVDLGIPTYTIMKFYLKMRSDNTPAETGCRINSVVQYG